MLLQIRGHASCVSCQLTFLCHSADTPSRFYPLTSFPLTGDLNQAPPFLRSPWPRWVDWTCAQLFFFFINQSADHVRTKDIVLKGSLHHYWITTLCLLVLRKIRPSEKVHDIRRLTGLFWLPLLNQIKLKSFHRCHQRDFCVCTQLFRFKPLLMSNADIPTYLPVSLSPDCSPLWFHKDTVGAGLTRSTLKTPVFQD